MRPTVSMGTNRTHKIMDLHLDGVHLECIRKRGDPHPYRIYRIVANHKRQVAKYSEFISVLYFITEFYSQGIDTMTIAETISWSKEWGSL